MIGLLDDATEQCSKQNGEGYEVYLNFHAFILSLLRQYCELSLRPCLFSQCFYHFPRTAPGYPTLPEVSAIDGIICDGNSRSRRRAVFLVLINKLTVLDFAVICLPFMRGTEFCAIGKPHAFWKAWCQVLTGCCPNNHGAKSA